MPQQITTDWGAMTAHQNNRNWMQNLSILLPDNGYLWYARMCHTALRMVDPEYRIDFIAKHEFGGLVYQYTPSDEKYRREMDYIIREADRSCFYLPQKIDVEKAARRAHFGKLKAARARKEKP